MLHQVYMSNLFKLDYKDYLNGFFVTVGGAITATLLQIIMNGGINLTKTDWETVMTAAVVAGLTYLQKRFFSDEQGKLGGKL